MRPSSADGPRARSVGFLAAGWHPDVGGVETHTRALARELVAAGWRVEALAADARDAGEPYSTRDEWREGVRVRRVAYRYHDHRALADLARRERAEAVVLAWARERDLALVHVHHLTAFGASVPLVLRASGVRVVMTLHDYWMLCPRGQMWHPEGSACARVDDARCGRCLAATWPHLVPSGSGERRGPRGEIVASDRAAAALRTELALEALGAADRLLAPSRAVIEAYARAGVPRERLELAPHQVDAEAIAQAVERERAALPPRGAPAPFVLGVLGAVQPSKGVLELARAVLATGIDSLVLEVHGPRESYHGDRSSVLELEALAARSPSVRIPASRSPRVRMMGAFAHETLPRVLARLDAVAVPSRWAEAFGLSAREALAAGLPVLASRTGGLADLEGEPGVTLLDPDDRDAWVDALRALVRDRTLAPRAASARARPAPPPAPPRDDASPPITAIYESLLRASPPHAPRSPAAAALAE